MSDERSLTRQSSRFQIMDLFAMILISIGCALLLIYIFPLTSPNDDSKIWYLYYLNMTIYFLAILVAMASIRNIWFLSTENKISLKAENSAISMLNEYKEGSIASPSFKQIIDLLPIDSYKKTEIGLLIKRILEDAKDYIYDPRESILRPYSTELYKKLNVFDSVQSNALRLGILGTFIGLILAISELAGMVGSNGSNSSTSAIDGLVNRRDLFVNLSEQLFSAMRYSFGTSIAGLVVSIYSAILAAYSKYKVNQAIRNTESAAIAIISLARRATYKDDGILSSFAQIKNSINILKESVQQQMVTASESMQQVSSNVLDQTQQMKHSIDVLGDYKDTWHSHVEFIKDLQEKTLEISQQQNKVAHEGIALFKQEIITHQSGLLEEVTKCMNLLSAEKLGEDINQHFSTMNKTLNTQMYNAFDSLTHISDNVSGRINELGQQLSTTLVGSMQKIENGLSNTSNLLLENINEDLSSFSQSVKMHNENKDQLVNVLQKNANYSQELTEQLKKNIPLEKLLNIQDSLKGELKNIFSAQQQLNHSIGDLRNHPVHENLFTQISDTAFSPLTKSLTNTTNKISELEDNMVMLSKVACRLDTQLCDISKNAQSLFHKMTGKSIKFAIITNAIIGTLVSFAALSVVAYFIYIEFI